MTADYMRGLAGGAPVDADGALDLRRQLAAAQPRQGARRDAAQLACSTSRAERTPPSSSSGAPRWPAPRSSTRRWCRTAEPARPAGARWSNSAGSLRAISEVVGSTVTQPSVAIIHDTDARWGNELSDHPSVDVDVIAETRRWHSALLSAGVTSDIRRSIDDLGGYELVIVPVQYLITQQGIDNLTRYVEGGGAVVVTYFSGIVDEDDHLHPGAYPGAFAELLGVSIEEFFPLQEGEQVELSRFGQRTGLQRIRDGDHRGGARDIRERSHGRFARGDQAGRRRRSRLLRGDRAGARGYARVARPHRRRATRSPPRPEPRMTSRSSRAPPAIRAGSS